MRSRGKKSHEDIVANLVRGAKEGSFRHVLYTISLSCTVAKV